MSVERDRSRGRTSSFSRNEGLESLLQDINESLWISEERMLRERDALKFPLLLIFGPMRSGTTLFMQWLANTGLVAYPTNLLSRFYKAPIIGAKIQLMLTDPRFSFRDELVDLMQAVDYHSENGKTRGALAPNEFWYFWRRFLPDPSRDVWTDDELSDGMDVETMAAELAGLTAVFNKPFAVKSMLFNYNIPFLNTIFEKAVFVQLRRDYVSNVASVLDARERQLGGREHWYSFRIPEYSKLKDLDPEEQAYIDRAVSQGIASIDQSRAMLVQYEEFCKNPRQTFDDLLVKLGLDKTETAYMGPERFTISRTSEIPGRKAIEDALAKFSGH
jgi:hypothetical protein